VRSGALLAVTPDYRWVGSQLAVQTRRVCAGESPGRIPVVPLRHTRIAFNYVAARALALPQAPPLVNLTVVP
jgi:ABC-type uncharacterized transport system substrate-binding protein